MGFRLDPPPVSEDHCNLEVIWLLRCLQPDSEADSLSPSSSLRGMRGVAECFIDFEDAETLSLTLGAYARSSRNCSNSQLWSQCGPDACEPPS